MILLSGNKNAINLKHKDRRFFEIGVKTMAMTYNKKVTKERIKKNKLIMNDCKNLIVKSLMEMMDGKFKGDLRDVRKAVTTFSECAKSVLNDKDILKTQF